eukprot:8520109-Alexandrium_andersonii.AAC.1
MLETTRGRLNLRQPGGEAWPSAHARNCSSHTRTHHKNYCWEHSSTSNLVREVAKRNDGFEGQQSAS